MRFSCILLLLLVSALPVFNQNVVRQNKLTLSTYHLLSEMTTSEKIPVLIKGDITGIKNLIRTHGENIKYTTGNIVAADISRATILALNAENYVEIIDCPVGKIVPMNDLMVKNNNVDSAYYGYAPLPMGYDGSGVVIGVIDAPFDIHHGDFKDAAGNSKIKSIWDQNAGGGPHPEPFTYGKECDSAQIAEDNCSINDNNEYNYSHGSGVAGVAASSGLAANRYRGVAPNADLILVSFDFDADLTSRVADAVQYIYSRADSLNKPCVINTSIGTYAGSHDGKDLLAQTIESLVSEHAGRSLVAAAGNAGNQLLHLSYAVTPTEQFTWFTKLSYMNEVYFELYADSSEFNDVNFSVGADDPATFTNLGTSPVINMMTDFGLSDGDIDSADISVPGAGSGKVYVQLMDGVYYLQFVIIPDATTTYWRFITSGSGSFDIWSSEAFTGFSNYVLAGLPDAGVLPDIVNYRLPNSDQTIVSSWECSDHVITVGSYVNRDTMTNYYGDNPPLVDTLGELFYSSSKGPTRDGRTKPDICASGARILSTEASVLSEWLISLDAADYMSPDGMHYLYNGTSFASPIVAGVAALYLQEFPTAWYDDVKNAILSTANQDTLTGFSLPDNAWGYGKVNAFRALLVPFVSVNELQTSDLLHIYPNPTGGILYITGLEHAGYVELFSVTGDKLISGQIDPADNGIDLSGISNGMYLLMVTENGNRYVKKVIVGR